MMIFTIADKISLFTLFLYKVFLVNLHFKATMYLKLASFFAFIAITMGLRGKQNIFQIGDFMALGSSFKHD